MSVLNSGMNCPEEGTGFPGTELQMVVTTHVGA